jgi:hypothetical protein
MPAPIAAALDYYLRFEEWVGRHPRKAVFLFVVMSFAVM